MQWFFDDNKYGHYRNSVLRGIGGSSTGDWISPMSATYSATNISASTGDKGWITASGATLDAAMNDVGITVPGSKSEQKFTTTKIGRAHV